MSLHPSGFQPPQWLRSPHLQSILSSSPLRARRARLRLHAERARHTPMVLEVGDGVRLQGVHSAPANGVPHALALLLHGWEGSVDSNYMRLTAARLLGAGFAVFRLNFRDHGDSHDLNEGLFHSNRIDEVAFLRLRGAATTSRRLHEQREHLQLWQQLTRIALDAPLGRHAPPFARQAADEAALDVFAERARLGPLTRRRLHEAGKL